MTQKVPVTSRIGTFIVSACRNGCPHAELFVDISRGAVGCNFCKKEVRDREMGAAVIKWGVLQKTKGGKGT